VVSRRATKSYQKRRFDDFFILCFAKNIFSEKEHTKGIRYEALHEYALLYAVLAMVGGVFYREFTKFHGFTAKTTLSEVHTHYFLLGMVFFLMLLVLEKNFSFTGAKTGCVLAVYHIGLNLTAVMFVVQGVSQVLGTALSSVVNAAISGIAGIGHILLGVSLVLLLVQIKRCVLAVKV